MSAPAVQIVAWRVEGFRRLGEGHTLTLLATAFGTTEERARANYRQLHAMAERQSRACGNEPLTEWQDHELTFTREG